MYCRVLTKKFNEICYRMLGVLGQSPTIHTFSINQDSQHSIQFLHVPPCISINMLSQLVVLVDLNQLFQKTKTEYLQLYKGRSSKIYIHTNILSFSLILVDQDLLTQLTETTYSWICKEGKVGNMPTTQVSIHIVLDLSMCKMNTCTNEVCSK